MDTNKVVEVAENKKYVIGLKALSVALRELGLPFSSKTLRAYEKAGVIPSFKNPKGHRVYTQEDIEAIVRIVAGRTDIK